MELLKFERPDDKTGAQMLREMADKLEEDGDDYSAFVWVGVIKGKGTDWNGWGRECNYDRALALFMGAANRILNGKL